MKYKLLFGWIIILIIALIPVFLWNFLGPDSAEFNDYSSITHSLGEITGLVAMTLFALTFILSTRISFIEDLFGGLDKVYIAHGVLGGTAFMLILSHPILLVLKFIPDNMKLAATYLLPSSHWSINFGIIALLGMIALIYITLFTKIKYNRWKFTHEFFGLIFVFSILHIVLVKGDVSQDYIFKGYYIYAVIVSVMGLTGFIYSLFLKDRMFKAAAYEIKSITKVNETSYEVVIVPVHKPIAYKSGQFVFVRFYNQKLSTEAHPFSIASSSNNPEIKVVIKSLGDFTSNIALLKIGDKVSVEGPYGRFNYDRTINKDQIWVAGGIGITPFLGMAEDLLDNQENSNKLTNKIELYYSVRDDSDFVGLNGLNYVASKNNQFKVIPWLTKTKGYLQVKDISILSGNLTEKEFYLCGPNSLKESITEGLLKLGISRANIHSEEFEFR
ncbi:ferric reductase-like transmembrane domain-containing protein [Candidatus Woesearchaeota archaeon]|nr:ferric reductase-like transmembrane domain-containing protein [Candidatus Woesearchaeota archaeon]